jgi:hypothetical protein
MPQDRYIKDKKGNQSLVKSDGTYVRLANGKYKYQPKGSSIWKEINDPKAIDAIGKMDSRLSLPSNDNGYAKFDPNSITSPPSFDPGDNSVKLTPSSVVEGNDNFSTQSDKPLWAKGRDYLKSNEGKYKLSQLKDVSKDMISPVLQYVNNIKAQKQLDNVKIPSPILAGMVQANKFNNNVELSAINNNLANDNSFAQSKFTDSQTAAAMRGIARTNALSDIAKSNANKNNIDMQTAYDASKVNLGTTMQNNALIGDYNNQNMIKQLSSIQAKQGFRNTLLGGFDNAMKAEQIRKDNETKVAVDTATYADEYQENLKRRLGNSRMGYAMGRDNFKAKNGGIIPKGKSSIGKMYC